MKSRRQAIKKGIQLLTFGSFLNHSTVLLHEKYSPSDPINLGLIGAGSRGKWLLSLIKDLPGIKVTACCDVIPERLDEGIAMAGQGCLAHRDFRTLLDDKQVDAVIIATPLSMHFEMVKAAVESGKHILCEKTMCFSREEALALDPILRDSGLVFQVGYQHRYNPLYHQIKSILRSEDFGELTGIECYWNRNGNWRRPVPDPKWERMINWRMYKEYSGGLMAELSSHQIDIVNWILEETPVSVGGYGGIDYWKDGRETYDHVQAIYRYRSGIQASYTCLTTNAHHGYKMLFFGKNATVQVSGEQGHQAVMYIEPSWIQHQKKPDGVDGVSGATMKIWKAGEAIPIHSDTPGSDAEPTGASLAGFLQCIRDRKLPLSNYQNGRTSAICVAMANQAMEQQKVLPMEGLM